MPVKPATETSGSIRIFGVDMRQKFAKKNKIAFS